MMTVVELVVMAVVMVAVVAAVEGRQAASVVVADVDKWSLLALRSRFD